SIAARRDAAPVQDLDAGRRPPPPPARPEQGPPDAPSDQRGDQRDADEQSEGDAEGHLQHEHQASGQRQHDQKDHDEQRHGILSAPASLRCGGEYTTGMIYVGTSGWQYASWRGRFYPKGVPQRAWLGHYATQFPVVEVNNSFYMLPKETT